MHIVSTCFNYSHPLPLQQPSLFTPSPEVRSLDFSCHLLCTSFSHKARNVHSRQGSAEAGSHAAAAHCLCRSLDDAGSLCQCEYGCQKKMIKPSCIPSEVTHLLNQEHFSIKSISIYMASKENKVKPGQWLYDILTWSDNSNLIMIAKSLTLPWDDDNQSQVTDSRKWETRRPWRGKDWNTSLSHAVHGLPCPKWRLGGVTHGAYAGLPPILSLIGTNHNVEN